MSKRHIRQISTTNIPQELINHLAKISGAKPDDILLEIRNIEDEKIEIRGIINPFFDNLRLARTKENNKKISELIDLGKFIHKMNIKEATKIVECGEKPDFVIEYQNELIGVEHTGIYDDQVVAEIKTLKKVLAKSREKLKIERSEINGLFNLIVIPSKLKGHLEQDQNKLMQTITDFVAARYDKKEIEKPDFIDALVYSSHSVLELSLGEDYWLSELTTESIAKVISNKERKLDTYKENRSLNKYWLLMVIEGASSASSFNISLEKLPVHLTRFDKLFLFENFRGRIIESIKSKEMSYQEEFATVDVLLNSNFETRAVDSFTISLIKVERQMRRIFTFLIFQHDNYKSGDGAKLRDILVQRKNMYFLNFINGIDLIYQKTVAQAYGVTYLEDFKQIEKIISDRNKIFHGQVTAKRLSREELIKCVEIMKKWCKRLADEFVNEIGYDGFGRNAYHKSSKKISLKNLDKFESLKKYEEFLKEIGRKKGA